jgi:integrase
VPGELRAILDATTGEALAMFSLGAFAGLRASESRGLRWSDVELGSMPAVSVAQRADKWAQIGSPKKRRRAAGNPARRDRGASPARLEARAAAAHLL